SLERWAELFTEPPFREGCALGVRLCNGGGPLLERDRVDQLKLARTGLGFGRLDSKRRCRVVRVALGTAEATGLGSRPRRDECGTCEEHGHDELEEALAPRIGDLLLAPGSLDVLFWRRF